MKGKDAAVNADILSIGIYPISKPYHGGQRRVRELVDALRGDGLSVRYVPIFSDVSYPDHDEVEAEFAFDQGAHQKIVADGGRQDLDAQRIFEARPAFREKLFDRIARTKPRIVSMEHPWHAPLAVDIRARFGDQLRIVYSSQNVEWHLMPSHQDRARAEVLERQLVDVADLVVACTTADASIYETWGARRVETFGNGHRPRSAPEALQHSWRYELKHRKVVLFVGSAHPPNMDGFLDMFLPAPGCIGPDARIVMVGGVCHLVAASPRYQANRAIFDETVMMIGVQEDVALDALFSIADVVVLPIVSGGGSNLKTAEALLSLKPVVGTTKSFVGFEDYKAAPGVFVEDDPKAFKSRIRDILAEAETSSRTADEVEALTWSSVLARYPQVMRSLL
jgi:glycosyltransferase involved in cell wall biosynthesis